MGRKKGTRSLYDLMRSDDPLSEAATTLLHRHRREDRWVDYKEGLSLSSQEPILEVVKHIAAFANSQGGYLAFGFKDRTFEPVGVSAGETKILGDAAALQAKIAPYLDPPKSDLLVRTEDKDGKRFVFVYIPRTDAATHVMVREGQFHTASGESRCCFYPGQIYFRVSGQSIPIRSSELEDLLRQRLERARDELFRDLRVLSRKPPNTILAFSPSDAPAPPDAKRVTLSGAADAQPVAGISFTVTPRSLEEEFLGALAMFRARSQNLPSRQLLYRLYADRASLAVQRQELDGALRFSLLLYMPSFYWATLPPTDRVVEILRESAEIARGFGLVHTLRVAAVLNRGLYRELLASNRTRLLRAAGRQVKAMEDMDWARSFYLHKNIHADIGGQRIALPREQVAIEREKAAKFASQVADSLASRVGNASNRTALLALDFMLYAPRTAITEKALGPSRHR